MTAPKRQIRVALGSVEVTDTERRALAWHRAGRPAFVHDGYVQWYSGAHASRDECREYLRAHGERGLDALASEFLQEGGQTASMEANHEREGAHA